MLKLSEIKKPIVSEIKAFEDYFSTCMKSKVPLLNIITNYLLRRKGKMMRPMFVFLSAKLNGEVTNSTYVAASMIELLHTATLIHDDVVDESYERRGFFSINALWKSKIAVLLGDYLLARGLLLSVDNGEYELLKIVSAAVKDMSEGELLQIQRSRTLGLNKEQYFEIIKKKTATLISSCTACGAKSVNATDEVIDNMRRFGENIGMAFQIRDDLLDYEDYRGIGKPTGNDIKEKKFTLPLIHVLENVSIKERNRTISDIKKHNKNNRKVNEIIQFVKRNGGIEYAEQKMYDFKNDALAILDMYPDNEIKKSLIDIAEFTVQRKK